MPSARGGCKSQCIDETNVLCKKTVTSIGCVGVETNAPVDFNAGGPTRQRYGRYGHGRTDFEGEKWRHLDSNLRVRYRMGSPSGSLQLGTSKRSSSDFFKSSSIQSIDERIEASQFSMGNYKTWTLNWTGLDYGLDSIMDSQGKC